MEVPRLQEGASLCAAKKGEPAHLRPRTEGGTGRGLLSMPAAHRLSLAVLLARTAHTNDMLAHSAPAASCPVPSCQPSGCSRAWPRASRQATAILRSCTGLGGALVAARFSLPTPLYISKSLGCAHLLQYPLWRRPMRCAGCTGFPPVAVKHSRGSAWKAPRTRV